MGPMETSKVTREQNQGRESRCCGDFIARKTDSRYFHMKTAKTENELLAQSQTHMLLLIERVASFKPATHCQQTISSKRAIGLLVG